MKKRIDTRELTYKLKAKDGFLTVCSAEYRGYEIERLNGSDKFGPLKKVYWRWDNRNFSQLKQLKAAIDLRLLLNNSH